MHPNSPDYQFAPESIGWLHRKVRKGEAITAANLARIRQADAAAFADPVFQEMTLLALEQRLPVRSGRPPEDPVVFWKTFGATCMIKDRAAEIRAERKARGKRLGAPEIEPRIQAANEIARLLQMPISGASLLNRISAF